MSFHADFYYFRQCKHINIFNNNLNFLHLTHFSFKNPSNFNGNGFANVSGIYNN